MLVKLTLDVGQLAALHESLGEDWNKYSFYNTEGNFQKNEPFVIVKESKGQGNRHNPIPEYNVTLEIKEEYQAYNSSAKKTEQHYPEKVPHDILDKIFEAIGLYPK